MSEPLELKSAKFLSRGDLGLTETQYCGLVKTLALLESGALDHENQELGFYKFDMRNWQTPANILRLRETCDSVCCIGGTASLVMGRKSLYGNVEKISSSTPQLFRVFYPDGEIIYHKHRGWGGTTKDAAMVLRHYLETGVGDWDLPYRK